MQKDKTPVRQLRQTTKLPDSDSQCLKLLFDKLLHVLKILVNLKALKGSYFTISQESELKSFSKITGKLEFPTMYILK